MKKFSLILIAAALLMTGCYEDYVHDYGKDGVYFAYQYDLRTFVIGEGGEFNVTVALGGVMANKRDRAVSLSFDNSIVNANAYQGMMGTLGGLSGDYVTTAFKNAGVTSLEAAFEVTGGE